MHFLPCDSADGATRSAARPAVGSAGRPLPASIRSFTILARRGARSPRTWFAPLDREYAPLLLLSAGFHATPRSAWPPPMLSDDGFTTMAGTVRRLGTELEVPVGMVLEGLCLDALARCVMATLEVLTADEPGRPRISPSTDWRPRRASGWRKGGGGDGWRGEEDRPAVEFGEVVSASCGQEQRGAGEAHRPHDAPLRVGLSWLSRPPCARSVGQWA